MYLFYNFFYNSTCFEQPFRPSSGVRDLLYLQLCTNRANVSNCLVLRLEPCFEDHFVSDQEFMIYCICSSVQTMQTGLTAWSYGWNRKVISPFWIRRVKANFCCKSNFLTKAMPEGLDCNEFNMSNQQPPNACTTALHVSNRTRTEFRRISFMLSDELNLNVQVLMHECL